MSGTRGPIENVVANEELPILLAVSRPRNNFPIYVIIELVLKQSRFFLVFVEYFLFFAWKIKCLYL